MGAARFGVRYFELYVPCPRCQAQIEAEVTVADGRVEVLRHDLCPNELGNDGHPLNSTHDLQAAARSGLTSAGLI
jgi:hypothetical protein